MNKLSRIAYFMPFVLLAILFFAGPTDLAYAQGLRGESRPNQPRTTQPRSAQQQPQRPQSRYSQPAVSRAVQPTYANNQPRVNPPRATQPQAQVNPALQPRRTASRQLVPPASFKLTPTQQQYLNQFLETWEKNSSQVRTFKTPFVRQEYNMFSPTDATTGQKVAYNLDQGTLGFQKPDKGSFHITERKQWKADPAQKGKTATGTYEVLKRVIGERWVCTGTEIYEYRAEQKQLVVRAIPKELQGEAISNGPLPFIFGAKAADMKARYWMQLVSSNATLIHLRAYPKRQADAANYRQIDIHLDAKQWLPKAMKVVAPDNSFSVYIFDLKKATVNGKMDILFGTLFQTPSTPWGWKKVLAEQPTPQAQAPQRRSLSGIAPANRAALTRGPGTSRSQNQPTNLRSATQPHQALRTQLKKPATRIR